MYDHLILSNKMFSGVWPCGYSLGCHWAQGKLISYYVYSCTAALKNSNPAPIPKSRFCCIYKTNTSQTVDGSRNRIRDLVYNIMCVT